MNAEIVKPLTDWYRANRRDLPWRHTSDPYRIWVSEIMLQQTRVESVKAYYQHFLEALPDLSALAEADEERLLKLWEGLGYYSRVRNMQRAARTVVEDFKGAFPRTKEEMEKLPGIGSYTAGAVASIAFGERVPAVDGNVLRVWARMTADDRNILLPSVKKEAERDIAGLMQTLPAARTSGQDRPGAFHENAAGDFNQALIELGALLCLPGEKPLCEACPVRPFCGAERRGLAGVLPVREKKTERRIERRTVLLVRSGELTAVRKRPDSGLLAGMYEFPNVRGELTAEQAVAYTSENGYDALRIRPLPAARHLFSHVEWRMTGYEIRIGALSGERGRSAHGRDWIFADAKELSVERPLPAAFSAYAKLIHVFPGKGKSREEEQEERNGR